MAAPHVVHIITRFDGGGSAVNTWATVMGMVRRGWRQTLMFGPSHESAMRPSEASRVAEMRRQAEAAGVGLIEIPHLLRRPAPLADLLAVRKLKKLLHRLHPDIVHTHTSKGGFLGRLAARGGPWQVLHPPHGSIFDGYFPPPITWIFTQMEQLSARWCGPLVALTEGEKDDQLAHGVGVAEQWRVIPSGVDLSPFLAIDKSENPLTQKRWISVGRLTPIKGMDRAIRALAVADSDTTLTLVGEGEERGNLLRLATELGVSERVILAGFHEDLAPRLAQADCFVLLSRNEGMGRAVVEAMAAGLPVVVADVGGMPELVVAGGGAVVHGDDAPQVAAACARLCNPEAARQAERVNRQRARTYDLNTMLDGLEGLYRQMLAGRLDLSDKSGRSD